MGQQKKSKVYSVSDDEFRTIIQESNSYRQALIKLGYAGNGKAYDFIKKRCKELNILTEHFNSNKPNKSNYATYSLDEIMVENSTYYNTSSLKQRIIRENILEYKCALCGNTGEWNGKTLVLQLDHINGNHTDHRKENLRFLCPNCHSQTETFTSRQRRAKSVEKQ